MNDIITIISQVGFPIGACIYLAISQAKIIDRNTQAINALAKVISELKGSAHNDD